MEELKSQLAAMCESKLAYCDIVDECRETVDFGLIIGVLFDCLADMMRSKEVN